MANNNQETPLVLGWWAYQWLRLRLAARGAGSVASNVSEYVAAAFFAVLGVWRLKVTIAFTGDATVDAGLTGLALTWILVVLWRFVFGSPYQMQSGLQNCLLALTQKMERLRGQMSPDIVRRSPRYVVLKDQFHPETGVMAPASRMELGLIKLGEIAEAARGGDAASYYLAAEMGEWILATARKHHGTATPRYAEIRGSIERIMAPVHDDFLKQVS